MAGAVSPRVLSIPVGVPFLPTLADALLDGRLVPGFRPGADPLALADVTIYVPTRRAARALRSVLVEKSVTGAAILPLIRPLGEFEDDAAIFEPGAETLDLAPPIDALDRVLLMAPLVQAWKRRLPAHIAARFGEDVTVPASAADAVWLARDLAGLIDEIETEGADWSRLAGLVPEELAGWWQVTLDFLDIVTRHLPDALAERVRSSPGAHRRAMIDSEAERLARNPPAGPVIAAGSTGSIPATARLLGAIARLERGAVVLPGLDIGLDARSWSALSRDDAEPSVHGHPQYGLCRLLKRIGVEREDVAQIVEPGAQEQRRARFVADALRPADTTDAWSSAQPDASALDGVCLIEAATAREEALAAAVALRHAIDTPGRTAAFVSTDRDLARRVAVELRRFGIEADDSAGRPLSLTPPATLLRLVVEAALRPGDPVALVALLKHPLMRCGLPRANTRASAEILDLVCFRGGTGRPALVGLGEHYERRLRHLAEERFRPSWLARLSAQDFDHARDLVARLADACHPLAILAASGEVDVGRAARASVEALEALGREEDGGLAELYRGEAGADLAAFLRSLVSASESFAFTPAEWPDILAALISGETVKPAPGADQRLAIWGALEARLQHVDTIVLAGLNEGSWPRRAEPDRFMSRLMKAGLELGPPERRIGQSAHDFVMAAGAPELILTRSLRAGEAPAVASRWLQRIDTLVGPEGAAALRARGFRFIDWARQLDTAPPQSLEKRPEPKPPLAVRPKRFSVTEIETLRRDPYAVYARRILKLRRIDPLIRDPGAAERGNLFHDILHAFTERGIDPLSDGAEAQLLAIGRELFEREELPTDVAAVWWPRFVATAAGFIRWEHRRQPGIVRRMAEAGAMPTDIGATGVTLSGRADRIDLHAGGMGDILDYKTGSNPSKAQAHTLLAPQLALEGALLTRGAFRDAGPREPSELAFVRLRANGLVEEESILDYKKQPRTAADLSDEAWRRLEALVAHYAKSEAGYLSRALPFREGDTDGDYDHLARVLEWSAGGGAEPEADA